MLGVGQERTCTTQIDTETWEFKAVQGSSPDCGLSGDGLAVLRGWKANHQSSVVSKRDYLRNILTAGKPLLSNSSLTKKNLTKPIQNKTPSVFAKLVKIKIHFERNMRYFMPMLLKFRKSISNWKYYYTVEDSWQP